MVIDPLKVTIRDLCRGLDADFDNEEHGARAYSNMLDIRPPYQREFIYPPDKQKKVIETIINGYPINVFYWGTTGITGYYELIDGNQRTSSICHFVHGDFSIELNGNTYTFNTLPQDIKMLS